MPATGPDGRPRPAASRRREQSDLYATILEVVKRHEGTGRITRISYGAGMPVDRLRAAVERMTALGLLEVRPQDGFVTYDITARGQEFLNTYWKMRSFTELFAGREARPAR